MAATQQGISPADFINSIGNQLAAEEEALRTSLKAISGEEVSPTMLLQLQADTQRINMLAQMQSQLVKDLADLFKDIIAKT